MNVRNRKIAKAVKLKTSVPGLRGSRPFDPSHHIHRLPRIPASPDGRPECPAPTGVSRTKRM